MVCKIYLIRTNNSPKVCASLCEFFIYLLNAESALVCKGMAGGGMKLVPFTLVPAPPLLQRLSQDFAAALSCFDVHPSACVLGSFSAWWSP